MTNPKPDVPEGTWPQCGQPSKYPLIDFACVLPIGHLDEHQPGGVCGTHGHYISTRGLIGGRSGCPTCFPHDPTKPGRQFRKKPVVIEAVQFFLAEKWPEGVQREPGMFAHCYVVTAHEQRAYLVDGDWIIPEPDGRGHYPCKPDIFAATYEPAEPGGKE